MNLDAIPPDACRSMAEVRAGVDAVDAALIGLLSQRFGYMRAAARLKSDRAAVRDEARKAAVIARVKDRAVQTDVPVELAEALWEQLVEASIAYEARHWDELRGR